GVATLDAMVSGLAPGRLAVTMSVGKSTLGRSLTGSERYATRPNSAMASISRLVAMGRLINVSEKFISHLEPAADAPRARAQACACRIVREALRCTYKRRASDTE